MRSAVGGNRPGASALGAFAALAAAALIAAGMGCADEGAKPAPVVEFQTSVGSFQIELDPERAPVTVHNFLRYADEGFYDGTIVHRVLPGFIIQCGGFTSDLRPKKPTHPPIPLESANGLSNIRGAVAMARTSAPNSATCQFFINLDDNPRLDYPLPDGYGYAVFGRVVAGMSVVDSVARVPTQSVPPLQNAPVVPILIEQVVRIAP